MRNSVRAAIHPPAVPLAVHPAMGPRESARWIAFAAASTKSWHRESLRNQVISRGFAVEVFDAVIHSIDDMRGRAA